MFLGVKNSLNDEIDITCTGGMHRYTEKIVHFLRVLRYKAKKPVHILFSFTLSEKKRVLQAYSFSTFSVMYLARCM